MSDATQMELYEFLDDVLPSNPELGFTSHQRVLRYVFEGPGVDYRIVEGAEARRYGVPEGSVIPKFNAFSDFIGREPEIWQYYKFVKAAAANAEQARQIAIFVGPTSTGKSTFELTKYRYLEGAPVAMLDPYRDGTGCPNRDRVFWMVPRSKRSDIVATHDVTIEPWADICAVCRHAFHNDETLAQYAPKDADDPEKDRWRHFPVTIKKIGMREGGQGIGFGTLFPMGQFSADDQKIIGEEDITQIDKYPRGHIKTLLFNGFIAKAQQGMGEGREIYKIWEDEEIADKYTFMVQEKIAPGPGGHGQVSVDIHLTGHSNYPDYVAFHDRGRASVQIASREEVIFWRHMSAPIWEAQLYQRELDKTSFIGSDGHTAPDMLDLVAYFTIATRIDQEKHHAELLSLLEAFDGHVEGKHRAALLEESPNDFMDGRDSRTSTKAIEAAYAADAFDVLPSGEVINGISNVDRCPIWPDVREEILESLHPAKVDYDPDTRKQYIKYLRRMDYMYKKRLQERVLPLLYSALTDDARAFFAGYVERATTWVRESETRDATSDIDADFATLLNRLKDDEAIMGVSSGEAEGVRAVAAQLAQQARQANRELDWRADPTMAERIGIYLRNTAMRTALPENFSELLQEQEYCLRCAQKTAAYVQEHKEEILTA